MGKRLSFIRMDKWGRLPFTLPLKTLIMCIEFLSNNSEEYELKRISKKIYKYFKKHIPTEDELEKYLSKQYKAGNIVLNVDDDCNYKLSKVPEGYRILISKNGCQSGMRYDILITETDYRYKVVTISDDETYDDMIYIEFNDDMLKKYK